MELITNRHTITFDSDQHKYYDELGRIYTSATQLLNEVTPQFNHRYWVMYKALEAKGHKVRPDIPNCMYIYVDGIMWMIDNLYCTGKFFTSNKIQELTYKWESEKEAACLKGNIKHNYLEDCINQVEKNGKTSFNTVLTNPNCRYRISTPKELEDSPLKVSDPLIYKKLANYINNGWTIYAEQRIYNPIHLIAGTIDIFIVRDKEFKILDWKTNKDDIKFNSGYYKKENGIKTNEWISRDNRLLEPLRHLQECKGIIYSLQLSIYSYICEMWGLKCVGLELCHFGNKLMPTLYNINYLKDDVELLFNWKKNNKQ